VVSSGATIPARAPASIDMLQIVIRPSIERARMAEPRYSMIEPIPPPVPMRADDREDHVLGGDAAAAPRRRHRHRPRPLLGQRLRREDVLDLARADAEGERPEGAVGRGVAVAADIVMPGSVSPMLGPIDVDDALAGCAHRVERIPNSAQLRAASTCVARCGSAIGGRCRSSGTLWSRWRPSGPGGAPPARQPQPVERLGRGDLVDEVEVDVEEVRARRRRTTDAAPTACR
jgi:hypothetical protein